MPIDYSLLNPQELVVLLIAIGGLIPLLLYWRDISQWLLLAYGFFLIGAITTNIENLLWHDLFNFIEHSIGNLGVGVTFAIIAYLGRQRIRTTDRVTPVLEEE